MRTRSAVLLLCAVAVAFALFLVGCTAGPNAVVDTPNAAGEVAGFWRGLWHGFISPFTFLVSLFSKSVGVYEVHNNGGWYNFGFLFGASMFFGGGGAGGMRGRRRKG